MQCPFSSRHLEATGFSQLAKSAYPSCTMTCLWLNNPSRSSLGKTSPVCHPFLSRAQKVLWPPSTYHRHAFRIHPEPKLAKAAHTTQQQWCIPIIWSIDAPINNLCLNICMIPLWTCTTCPCTNLQPNQWIHYKKNPEKKWDIWTEEHLYLLLGLHPTPKASKTFVPDARGARLWHPGEGIIVCCFVWLKKVWSQQKSHLCWVFLIVETLPAIMDFNCQVTSVSFRKK